MYYQIKGIYLSVKCRDNRCLSENGKYLRHWGVTDIVLWNNMRVHREARSGSFRDPPMGPDFGEKKKYEWQLMGRDKYLKKKKILFQLCHELHI